MTVGAFFCPTGLKRIPLAGINSDPSELMSSTPRTFGDEAPVVTFQHSGPLQPLQPSVPNADEHRAIVHPYDSRGNILTSSSQHAAAAALQDFDNALILDWLSVLRSLGPDHQRSSGSGGLSLQQLIALSAFKDCQNEDIVACLQASRQGKGWNADTLWWGLTESS